MIPPTPFRPLTHTHARDVQLLVKNTGQTPHQLNLKATSCCWELFRTITSKSYEKYKYTISEDSFTHGENRPKLVGFKKPKIIFRI
jgi:hypothetical protein